MTSNLTNVITDEALRCLSELQSNETFLSAARRVMADAGDEYINSLPKELLNRIALMPEEERDACAMFLAMEAAEAGLDLLTSNQNLDRLMVSENDKDEAMGGLINRLVKKVVFDKAMAMKEKVGTVESTSELADRFATGDEAVERNEFIGIPLGLFGRPQGVPFIRLRNTVGKFSDSASPGILGASGIGKSRLFRDPRFNDPEYYLTHGTFDAVEDDEDDDYDFDVTLDDVVRNYEYTREVIANSYFVGGSDDVKWENLAFTYMTNIARELDCDLDETMDVIASEGYWSLPSEYQAKRSDALKEYFLLSPETQGIIHDSAIALIERTEEAHQALGVKSHL